MYKYYNANPRGRNVDDCTVRAISLATNRSWDTTYEELSYFAQKEAIMPNEVDYIDKYLEKRYPKLCGCRGKYYLLKDFLKDNPRGVYLITMSGHITCVIDGVVYDTFDPTNKPIWDIYIVNERES